MKWAISQKIVFVLANLLLAVTWLHFLVHLISRWDPMTTIMREDIGALMLFFSLLWITIIREKRNVLSLLCAGFAFTAAYEIVRVCT
jgi:hypothetical protein